MPAKTKPEQEIEATAAPEPETTTETPLEPIPFKIVYSNVILARTRIGDSAPGLVYGDVAQLSDGRLMARVAGKDIDGETIYAYEEWAADANARTDFAAAPRRDAQYFGHALTELGYAGTISQTDLRTELTRFGKEYPQLLALLDLEREHPAPKFDPGICSCPTRTNAPFWFDMGRSRHILDQYASGDWGNWGVGDFSMTEEEAWLTNSLPRARANVVAILRRSGVVKAQYPLQPHLQAQWDEHFKSNYRTHKPGAIEFMTLVRPSGNKTIARTVFATED